MFLSKTLRGWLFHLSSSASDVNSRSRGTAYQETGKFFRKEVSLLIWALTVLFIPRYAFLGSE